MVPFIRQPKCRSREPETGIVVFFFSCALRGDRRCRQYLPTPLHSVLRFDEHLKDFPSALIDCFVAPFRHPCERSLAWNTLPLVNPGNC